MNSRTPWPSSPDQINLNMLEDIAQRVAAAMPDDKKVSQQSILDIINKTIDHHYMENRS